MGGFAGEQVAEGVGWREANGEHVVDDVWFCALWMFRAAVRNVPERDAEPREVAGRDYRVR